MPSIDERIVSMSFENRKFESAISDTMRTLNKLETALQQVGAKNSLSDIEKSANKVTLTQPMSALDKLKSRLFGAGTGAQQGMSDIEKAGSKVTLDQPITALGKVRSATAQVGTEAAQGFGEIERSSASITFGNITSGLEAVTAKFSILRAAAAVTLGNIATRAISTGTQVVKSLTLAPVMEGFHNYETQINAVQTIMANTGLSGKKGLGQVQGALNNLNKYANLTVYNFSEMARNIGTFTAAGVDLKTAVGSIKGIANLAALSGSTSQQASSAMYQLSQAIAAGRVNLQDWNSVVNAGIGGKVFQKALADTASAMGTLKDGSVKLVGPMKQLKIHGETFRQSIQSKPGTTSWLTSDVLTKTLEHFTGDMSKAQLKAQGFSDSQIKGIQKQGQVAVDAATKIKTITQLMQALKEEVGSAWASVFKTLFGNIFTARKLFSALHNAAQNALTKPIYALNRVLQGWVKLGGRIELVEALKQGAKDIGAILKPIKAAFRDIFPPVTARKIFAITKGFHNLMDRLKIGPKTADELRRTFRGVFALFDIGKSIVSGIIGAFTHMFGIIGHGAGGFLAFTATIGDALVVFRDWLKQGDRIKKFFGDIGSVLAQPAKLISGLLHELGKIFNVDTGTHTADSLDKLNKALDPTARLAQIAQNAWSGFVGVLKTVASFLQPVISTIGDVLKQAGDVIASAFNADHFDKILSGVQTGLIAGIFLTLKKGLGGGLGFSFKGEIKGVSDALSLLTGHLKTMQTSVKANTLLKIAGAVGILAFSIALISKIKPEKIATSMTAMAIGLAQLLGAMAILGRSSGGKAGLGFAKLPVIAASMLVLATALGVLTGVMILMSTMKWESIAKGLAGISGLLLGLSVAVQPLSKGGPGIILASTAMIALGIALTIMSGAMKVFATMKWEDIGKGLAAVAGLLIAIGIASRALGPQLLITGPALVAVSFGLTLLAGTMKVLSTISWGDMAKGILGIAGALVAIGLAMNLMPLTLPITAAGLIVVGIALGAIAGVIGLLGRMKISTLVKGIAAIGLSLVVLAGGLTLMMVSLPGAAALLVTATALAIFAPALALFGKLSWGVIIKGLIVVGASLLVIGTAGLIAAPAIAAIGIALIALGAGVIAVGFGIKLIASGFALLGDSAGKGLAVFLTAVTAAIAIFPKIAIEFVKGLVEALGGIINLAAPLVKALGDIITIVIDLIIKEVPKFAQAIEVFIGAFASIIIKETPRIVAAGMAIILGLLRGIDLHIDEITRRAISIMTKFLTALGDGEPKLIDAGARAILKFLEGVAKHIAEIATKGLNIVAQLIIGIGRGAGNLISAGGDMIAHIIKGIGDAAWRIVKSAVDTATTFIKNVALEIPKQVNKVATAVIKMINRLAKVVRKREPEFMGALFNLGEAIVLGIIDGFRQTFKDKLLGVIQDALKLIPGPIKKFLHLNFDDNKPNSEDQRRADNAPKHPSLKGPFAPTIPKLDAKITPSRPAGPHDSIKSSFRTALASAVTGPGGPLDIQPKITPVLDLSAVHKEAKKMPRMVTPVGLSTDATLKQARAILSEKTKADRTHAEATRKAAQPPITFVQNNRSPESLSEREIYRRTHNQLSRIRREIHTKQ